MKTRDMYELILIIFWKNVFFLTNTFWRKRIFFREYISEKMIKLD